MKIKWNPIIRKELKIAVRRKKILWGLIAYEGILIYIFSKALSVLRGMSIGRYQDFFGNLIVPLIMIAQIGMTALAIPVMTASSISGERERQTFDIMLTTCLSPMEIVFGKVFSAIVEFMLYVAAGIPITVFAYVRGGLSVWIPLLLFVVIFVFAVFLGSIGVFCSSVSRKSATSILWTFGLCFAICFLTWMPEVMVTGVTRGHEHYDCQLFLLLNPLVFLEEFSMLSIRGYSFFSGDRFDSSDGFFTQLFAHGSLWCILSGVCLLGLSLLFMYLAARKIDPLAGKVKKIRKKQLTVQTDSTDAGKAVNIAGSAKTINETGGK